jgi:hypothetical protein
MNSGDLTDSELKEICSFVNIEQVKNGRIARCEKSVGGGDDRYQVKLENTPLEDLCVGSKVAVKGTSCEWFYVDIRPMRNCDYCNAKRGSEI